MVNECMGRNANGHACSAQPVRPSGYCYWHDPQTAQERAEGRRRGGKNRSNRARAQKATDGMDLHEIDLLLGVAFKKAILGTISPGAATAAATVARAMLAVREHGTLERIEERLADLERIAGRGRSA